MRIARELTKPTITLRGTNRISLATPSAPSTIWRTPARITAATRYPKPCSRFSGAMTRATAPVAAEIIARRPPTTEIVTAMVNEANRPTAGSTPAMIENEIASGMSASPTTRPASTSVRQAFGSESQAGAGGRSREAADSGENMQPFPCRAPAPRPWTHRASCSFVPSRSVSGGRGVLGAFHTGAVAAGRWGDGTPAGRRCPKSVPSLGRRHPDRRADRRARRAARPAREDSSLTRATA